MSSTSDASSAAKSASTSIRDAATTTTTSVSTTLTLRFFAVGYVVAYLVALVVGFVITMTLTAYDAERDFVYRFFDAFNPCTFFDHFPSNAVELLVYGTAVLFSIGWSVLLLVIVLLSGNASVVVSSLLLLGFSLASDIVVPDIFATNLYEHEYPAADEPLSATTIFTLVIHAMLYVVSLLGNMTAMVAMVAPLRAALGGRLGVLQVSLLAFGFLTMSWAALSMLMTLFAGGAMFVHPYRSFVAMIVDRVHQATQLGVFSTLPRLYFRFIMPPAVGIRVRVSTVDGTHGRVRPENLISTAFLLLALMTLGTAVFVDPDTSVTALPLASGFTAAPYRFVFIPLWFLCILFLIVAVVLTTVREHLIGDDYRKTLVTGVLWVLSCFSFLLIAIPQLSANVYIAVAFLVTTCLYILSVFGDRRLALMWRAVLFVVVFLALAGVSMLGGTIGIAMNVALTLLLVAFQFIMPPQRAIFVSIEAVGIDVRKIGESNEETTTTTMTTTTTTASHAESLGGAKSGATLKATAADGKEDDADIELQAIEAAEEGAGGEEQQVQTADK